jgi:hypothetical protein
MNVWGREQPGTLVAAVVLIVIGAIGNVASIPLAPEDDRAWIGSVSVIIAALWLAGAWGLWQGWKWVLIPVFVLTAISGLLAAPGIVLVNDDSAAKELAIRILSAAYALQAIVVCWLLAQKSTRASLR